jgi:hypothetical protein
MNPTPQLSWSFRGSYRPVGFGTPEAFNRNEESFAIMSFLLSAVAPIMGRNIHYDIPSGDRNGKKRKNRKVR